MSSCHPLTEKAGSESVGNGTTQRIRIRTNMLRTHNTVFFPKLFAYYLPIPYIHISFQTSKITNDEEGTKLWISRFILNFLLGDVRIIITDSGGPKTYGSGSGTLLISTPKIVITSLLTLHTLYI